jgi:epoxyqueuosine reductase
MIHDLAAQCGFDLAGIAPAGPAPDFERFRDWTDRGLAGEMRYLTAHRAEMRENPESLLPGVRSVICVGLMYDGPEPYSTEFSDPERGWIARYAWGDDYHGVLRAKLEELATRLLQHKDFSWRACVDTAPLLERSFAHRAGLGWIGKNTCLINQQLGSWFFLGELLTTLDLPPDSPPPDRCGTCTRCIAACPTAAIVPSARGGFELDARLCISYFTIELRAAIPEEHRAAVGHNIFGCDICQDVCPWNRKGLFQIRFPDETPAANEAAPPLAPPPLTQPALRRMAELTEEDFKQLFRHTPVSRAKYSGFLRNVAVAMGNSGLGTFRAPLERLAAGADPLVAEHAKWALSRLSSGKSSI